MVRPIVIVAVDGEDWQPIGVCHARIRGSLAALLAEYESRLVVLSFWIRGCVADSVTYTSPTYTCKVRNACFLFWADLANRILRSITIDEACTTCDKFSDLILLESIFYISLL